MNKIIHIFGLKFGQMWLVQWAKMAWYYLQISKLIDQMPGCWLFSVRLKEFCNQKVVLTDTKREKILQNFTHWLMNE